ncbi:PilW family protein [Clostridium butyricum]|uniref:PilW family protein n=1 Tax=Clostridium butyricum TaxID=1492 RepID=UPI000903FCAA|nr:type II secretion system protein [Clostridium butyricum]APF24273.1 putative prepilin-type N-cleavage/methylation domain protein [Clostridium butyricum]
MKKKSGFTLLEMIIVLSMTVLILGMAASVFMTGNKVFSESDIKTTFQMDARDIQETISYFCMSASHIDSCRIDLDEIKDEKYNGDYLKDKFTNISGEREVDKKWLQVSSLTLKSVTQDSDINSDNDDLTNLEQVEILYDKDKKILKIGSKRNIDNVKNFSIQPLNLEDENNTISGSSGIRFNIILSKNKMGHDLDYPIDFTVYFRNR